MVAETCVDGVQADDVPRPERTGRPLACRFCSAPSWWNGWRLVFCTVIAALSGKAERSARWLGRAKCSSCKRGFTCYPDEQYPHRQYQLDVVAEVVAAVAIGNEPAGQAAQRAQASATSARRWTAWVSQLGSVEAILAVAQRLEQNVSVGVGISTGEPGCSLRSQAAQVLRALEALGQQLVRSGLRLATTTGLGRVLGWQLQAHGDVVYLVVEPRCLSPAMVIEAHRPGV